MSATRTRTITPRGRIAPLLYGEPARPDEILRQIGRRWAASIGVAFAEYDQVAEQKTVFAMSAPRDAGRHAPACVLSFGPAQPTEPMDPTQNINIDATCLAASTEDALALAVSLNRMIRNGADSATRRPFVHVPRLRAYEGVPGVPVTMVDLWPASDAGDQVWHGWRIVGSGVAQAPQLIGRDGFREDGTAEARMAIQLAAHPVTITAPPPSVMIGSTSASASVEVTALPSVGVDGLPDAALETIHLRWLDGAGDAQSVAIAFDEVSSAQPGEPTIAELKTAVEANAGWTLTIEDPPGGSGDALGIATRPARLLYSTNRIPVTAAAPAALRVEAPDS